jgi:DNA-binding NarL/FixJ family response regulator
MIRQNQAVRLGNELAECLGNLGGKGGAALSMGATERAGVVLDPLPLWLEALERVLNRIDIEVVGKAATYKDALDLLEQLHPDVFIAELEATDESIDPITFVRRACERAPETKMIILSYHDDDEWIDGALGAGACAYVFKTAHPDDLASTIRQTFQSSVFVPGSRVMPARAPSVENQSGLTRREIEILQLVSEGYSNAQVAKMLWVTQQTVKFHLSNIYRKLDVANRTEASRWAQVNNMLPRMMPAAVRP